MIRTVTSLGRSGLSDWLVQRGSSVVLLAYGSTLGYFINSNSQLDYAQWRVFFDQTWMQIFSIFALLALCGHAWVGMWAVSTDYLTTRTMGPKGNVLRLLFQFLCGVLLVLYLAWGIAIFLG